MHFTWSLVFAKTDVTVDPENSVFWLDFELWVVLTQSLYQIGDKLFKRFFHKILVLVAVLIKPIFVIIGSQVDEKLMKFFVEAKIQAMD
jgi:hypothetical protein